MLNRAATSVARSSMNKPFSSRFNFQRVAIVGGFTVALLPYAALPQSLWRNDSKSMFADKRGVNIGDIITIVVQENTTTTKDNKTETSKQAAMDASISTFFYSP